MSRPLCGLSPVETPKGLATAEIDDLARAAVSVPEIGAADDLLGAWR